VKAAIYSAFEKGTPQKPRKPRKNTGPGWDDKCLTGMNGVRARKQKGAPRKQRPSFGLSTRLSG
jgi:hypothetical protein